MQSTMLKEAKCVPLVIDECHRRGIGFCGLSEQWRGSRTRLVLLCGKHGAWRTTHYTDFMSRGIGCNQCGMEKLFKAVGVAKRRTESDWIDLFMKTGSFHDGHSFKRMFPIDRWSVHCSRCAQDEYALNGLCNGSFESSQYTLKAGRCPCRCGGALLLSEAQRAFMMRKLANEKGLQFLGWQGGKYKNPKSFAMLNCSNHGEFQTRSDSFTYVGSGCPGCARSGFNTARRGVVYALLSECGAYLKVGISNRPKKRMKELFADTPFRFTPKRIFRMSGKMAIKIETDIHRSYESAGLSGFPGCTEWLKYDPAIIEDIKNRA